MYNLKRIFSLIVCICALFALTSCDMVIDYVEQFIPIKDNETFDDKDPLDENIQDTTKEDDKEITDDETKDENDKDHDDSIGGDISSNDWNSAIQQEKFDNVTFSIFVIFPGETEPYPVICKLDGEQAAYSEGSWPEEVVDEETTASIRSIYMNTVLAILDNFSNFTYDNTTGTFVSKDDIVYNVQVLDYDAKITASNAIVKLDTNKNIAEISCHMKQEYIESGTPESMEFDAVFAFYNYGTTVVAPAAA